MRNLILIVAFIILAGCIIALSFSGLGFVTTALLNLLMLLIGWRIYAVVRRAYDSGSL